MQKDDGLGEAMMLHHSGKTAKEAKDKVAELESRVSSLEKTVSTLEDRLFGLDGGIY